MGLRVFGATSSASVDLAPVMAAIDDAKTAAATADAKAANARQMVLSDRVANADVIAPLQAAAAQLPLTQQQAAIDHAEFRTRLSALEAIQPIKGDPGKSAYELARDGGYGGTQAQWLTTLVGSKGDKGDPGAASTVPGPAGPSGTANLAVGARSVAALALNATTSITVPWSRTMPNTTYTIQWAHTALVSLANITITETARTTTSVTVTVKATGLALAAGTLIGVAL